VCVVAPVDTTPSPPGSGVRETATGQAGRVQAGLARGGGRGQGRVAALECRTSPGSWSWSWGAGLGVRCERQLLLVGPRGWAVRTIPAPGPRVRGRWTRLLLAFLPVAGDTPRLRSEIVPCPLLLQNNSNSNNNNKKKKTMRNCPQLLSSDTSKE
jgi:hypothetical protein